VLRTAARHQVEPLLYRGLRRAGLATVPEPVQQRLRHACYKTALRNTRLADELVRVLRLLGARGIAAIPYKGPALAMLAYGDLALRQFWDLDLLVHERDAARARDLLAGEGYSEHALSPSDAAADRCYEMTNEEITVPVELHWDLVPQGFCFRFDLRQLWQRARPAAIAGIQTRSLSPEDMLLLLCVHGCFHHWERLAWVCDVAAVVDAETALDWQSTMARATALGGRRMLFVGLLLARQLLGTALPVFIARQMEADQAAAKVAGSTQCTMFSDGAQARTSAPRALGHMKMRERWRDRARYLCHLALAPTQHERRWVRLPAALRFLYYAVRPIRLICTHGLGPLGRCVRTLAGR